MRKKKSRLSFRDVAERIAFVRNELDVLIDDLRETFPDDGSCPETDRLIEAHYLVGDPRGLFVALNALPDPGGRREATDIRYALASPKKQQARYPRKQLSPEAKALIATATATIKGEATK